MYKRRIVADEWSQDVRQQRIFLEINCPSASVAVKRLEAVAYELDIRAAVIEQLRHMLNVKNRKVEELSSTIDTVMDILGGWVETDGCLGEPVAADVAKRMVFLLQTARKESGELRKRVLMLERHRSELDCQYAGPHGETDGASHCPIDRPCMRCRLERAEKL